MVKIIFLDIDGVLNSDAYGNYLKEEHGPMYRDREFIDDSVCRMLAGYLSQHQDIKLCVSSSRRRESLDATIEMFSSTHGLNLLSPYIVGVTPSVLTDKVLYAAATDRDIDRGEFIKRWLDTTDIEVSGYCILDDDDNMLPEQQDFFIHIDDRVGLTRAHLQEIDKILNNN